MRREDFEMGDSPREAKVFSKPTPESPLANLSSAQEYDAGHLTAETQGCHARIENSPQGGRLATATAKPKKRSPSANSPSKEGRQAGKAPRPIRSTPDAATDGGNTAVSGDDGAQTLIETHASISPVIAELIQLSRMRRRWHKAEKSLTLQGKATARAWTEGDRDEANKLFDQVANGKSDDAILSMALYPFLTARTPFSEEREKIEKTMAKLAKSLPVWDGFAKSVKGFGPLRLAVLVGECGDIGAYRNPSCVWKRMGLAVIDGVRQRKMSDADSALVHGYNPERRSVAYVLGTEIIRAQIRKVKDEDGKLTEERVAIGPYGQLYLDRKAFELEKDGMTKAHAHNRAARYMVKRVLRELYLAFKRADEHHLTTPDLVNTGEGRET